ncbi:HAD-IIIC family phosphatase [Succinimonas sp.]|uniref:HAD-IIIC family phosphatase n=1 Tax=Succinimonas sp. TaxID=1936151 RepID=UPI0038663AE3
MDTVKLIIWDMDETFWKGTLSDGEVSPVPRNISIVKQLTDRGIVNSICSKNDLQKVKDELSGEKFEAVWDYFVFPSVDWTPKGQRVAAIIRDMNLRPVNCLFLDDNLNNLNEAKFVTPDLQIATPEEFYCILDSEKDAFAGKDDSSHSRLNHYKILEKKAAERSHSASNEEFLIQSEIKVEMTEKDLDLHRIHEMIHRNNQLNFTKDRISEDQVKAIFTDPAVRSGEVHVTDKYGDHGIVGCYALKDGRLLQFVFSCRILGMGVEQYVYEQLGWPEISVVGEVASKLTKGERITYINRPSATACCGCDTASAASTATSSSGNPKIPGMLLVYGNCPLRPVWAYIESKFEKSLFHLINPMPPVCNLGLMCHTDYSLLDEYYSFTNTLDLNTFDKDLLSGAVNYLLISFINELTCFKYSFKDDPGRYFYSAKIKDCDTRLAEQKISPDDLYNEMAALAAHLSGKTVIFILISPEVVFSIKGKNADYYDRINSNLVAEKLAREYSNIKLIDIRKYARQESDFFETVVNHYNRAIGYACARDLLEQISGNGSAISLDDAREPEPPKIPANALTSKVKSKNYDISYTLYIRNAELHFSVSSQDLSDVNYDFRVYCNRYEICRISSDKPEFTINVAIPGMYFVHTVISRNTAQEKSKKDIVCFFFTGKLSYSEYNYVQYIDPAAPNYDFCINSLNQFTGTNASVRHGYARFIQQLLELSCKGVSIGQYLLEKNIREIDVFFDDKDVGKAVLANLAISGISIRHVFTIDNVMSIYVPALFKTYQVRNINDTLPFVRGDSLLVCPINCQRPYVNKLSLSKASCYFLDYILSVMMTRTYFPDTGDSLVIAVQTGGFYPGYFAFRRAEATLLPERKHFTLSNPVSRQLLMQHKLSSFADFIKKSNLDKLIETLKSPALTQKDGCQFFKDQKGPYLNIEHGFRKTVGVPAKYKGTVYLVGNCISFGAGCSDEETIASFLQQSLKLPYRVVNYSNFVWDDWNKAIELLNSTRFTKDDVVVLLLPNKILPQEPQLLHWINYDGLPDKVVKVDALPLFYKKDRPIYFTLPNAYSPECNKALADLIMKAIMEHRGSGV